MILVTGATGQLGSAVIDQLLTRLAIDQFAGLARSDEKAQGLRTKGVQVRLGDLDEVSSLETAFAGIDKLLLISTVDHERAAQQRAVVEAAQQAGIQHIIYTGVAMKDAPTAATKFLMESHFQTEEVIKQSGLMYTFLRNSLYTDVIPMYVGKEVLETGIDFPAGAGKVAYALRREMGEATGNVLAQSGHENKTYMITGPQLYSYADVAAVLSDLSGKTVSYSDVNADHYVKKLKQAGLPAFMQSMLAAFAQDIKQHQFEVVTEDLARLLGRKPTALREALQEIYGF